jgi:chlorophyll(ide) b reductase
VNNAGTNAYRYGPLMDSSDDELTEIVSTNLLGIMLCCKEVGGQSVMIHVSTYLLGIMLCCKEVGGQSVVM